MHVVVNGQEQVLGEPYTVKTLLDVLGMSGQRIAVEVNQEIIPRSRHADHRLSENDRVEILFAIGGG